MPTDDKLSMEARRLEDKDNLYLPNLLGKIASTLKFAYRLL